MFLFKKKNKTNYTELYNFVKEVYDKKNLSEERKKYLKDTVNNNGYYPSSFENLSLNNSEILYCTDILLEKNLSSQINNSLQKNEIKVINLGALNNFIDFLKEIIITDTSVILYITPFYLRDFECEYFIKSFETDEKLKDNNLNLTADEQLNLFIHLTKKTGHKIICDLPLKFSRFSKTLLLHPYLARWIDTKDAELKIDNIIKNVSKDFETKYDKDDVQIIKNIYSQGSTGHLNDEYKQMFLEFETKVLEQKKYISSQMYEFSNQIKLQKRIKQIVEKIQGKNIKEEKDLTKYKEITEELISEGLWTVPCGIINENGLPVFDYMNTEEKYPVFKHFDKDLTDISDQVKHDFLTPAYFSIIEKNGINKDVLNYFTDFAKKYAEKFDGFKINATNLSSNNDGLPEEFLKKLSSNIKETTIILDTQTANLGNYKNVNFDIILKKDAFISPENMIEKYTELSNFNTTHNKNIAGIRTYNHIFSETFENNNYPAALGQEGAEFKWFCLHFLPAGRFAKYLTMYVDGDESFTKNGFTKTIYEYKKLKRNNNEDFFRKFDAISRFSRKTPLLTDGEAVIINEDKDGFVSWIVSKELLKEAILVVANYKPKEESIILSSDTDKIKTYKHNDAVVNKKLTLPGEYKIQSELVLKDNDFIEKEYKNNSSLLEFEIINPCEYRIFLLKK